MGLLNELSFEKELKPNIIVRQEKKMCDNIAIVGISLKGPKAENVEEFWKNISENQDCIGIVPDERKTDIDTYKSYILRGQEEKYSILEGGYLNEIDKFDYQFFNISPNEAKLMDPHQRIMLQVIWNAFVDAGYKTSNLKGKNIGIYIGFRADEPFDYKRLISEIMPEDSSLALAGNINSIISSRIAYLLDLTGPAMGIDTACSSSLTALHIACNAIKNGDCDGAIVGASSIRFLPINDEKQIGIESISGRVKSFDDNSDGTVFGEGVAAIVMKPLEKAIKDKDNIYAVIKGSAINQDGASIGLTAPNANAQEKVLMKAWDNAKINPRDISFIETHGTGTKLGDSIIALKIMNAINENNSAQISISDVMTYDSISSLALHIKNLSLTDKVDNEFEKVHIDDIESDQINEYPLSDAQSLIFKSCLDGNLSYNLPQLYRVKGKIDINKFNESINKIIERHDILRSVIKITANGIVQMIKQTMHYSVEKQEFNGKLEDVYLSLVEKFDFENGPLFRVKLVYVNKKLFVFFDIHHIIADGTSLGIFALEIMNAYHNLELPYVSWQYEKYVAYRKKFITTEKYQKQLDFWMKEHEKYKMNLDPYDNTNSIFSYHSKKYSYKCSSKLSTKLADYCQMHKVSIFAYILSTFRVVMHSYTGRNQLVIGLPTSGRTIADVENTIGMFVNTLPFVSHLDENAITTEMVNHTNEKLLKLVDNQDVFINEIESMDFNIDVLLVHQNYYNPDLVFEDMEVEKYDMEEGFSNYDMVFQTWIDEHELVGELEYNTSAFDIDKIEEILKCFEYVLENMLKGQLLISEINDKLFLTSDEFALPEFSF